jgi:ribose 5-phosphate isomerase A
MSQDEDKALAARAAAAEVKDGMLFGLGTGSTAAHLIEELGRRVAAGLRIQATATSEASDRLAQKVGIPTRPFSEIATVDLTIDGADEIDPRLRAIKGAGGAMLREKLVATAAARMIVIADGTKQVEQLGKAPVPVEVLPFGQKFVAGRLKALGATPVLRTRDGQPYRTDQNNLVIDCHFPDLADPEALAAALAAIPGMLGHGLFLDEVDAAYVASAGQVVVLERPTPTKA